MTTRSQGPSPCSLGILDRTDPNARRCRPVGIANQILVPSGGTIKTADPKAELARVISATIRE